MLNLNQLRVFYHAAKNLSFTAAARDLFVTQPAVTAQMKLFESHCNLKLFKKKGRRIHLTDEGKVLFEYAEKIFSHEMELENVIEEMRELKRGDLRIGTTKAYARYFMPSMLSDFHRSFPRIQIHLDEGSSLDMINSLVEFKNEVAIIAKAEDNPEVHFIPFSQEEVVLITAPDHPLARKRRVSFGEVANEPIIMKEIGSGTRKLVNELFEKEGRTPDILMETSNTEFIKQLVQRGEGVSFLVNASVAQEVREKKLAIAPLGNRPVHLDVSIAYLKKQSLSPPARAFDKVIRKLRPPGAPTRGVGALMGKILSQQRGR